MQTIAPLCLGRLPGIVVSNVETNGSKIGLSANLCCSLIDYLATNEDCSRVEGDSRMVAVI